MRNNPENLPALSRQNLDSVFQTVIDGCNSHLNAIRDGWKACIAKGASAQEISDAYTSVLSNLFNLSEVLGFAAGIYYTCGGNLDESLVRLESKGKSYPMPPAGQAHTEIDSIGARWILLCDFILNKPEHIGAESAPSVARKSDVDEKAETWPKFKDKGRQAAAKICEAMIVSNIGAIRPSYIKIRELEKIQKEGKSVKESQKLDRSEIATMFRHLCLLKFSVGLINGIAYSTGSAVSDLSISLPVPNSNPIVIPFADFKVKFEELVKGSDYYNRVSKAIISLIVAFRMKSR